MAASLLPPRRNLYLLWLGQVVSQVGNTFNYMALSWLILVLTGSPIKMGGVFLAQLLPAALVGIPAGVLADRFPRRILMIVADLVRFGLVISIPLVYAAGRLPLWYVYLATFLVSAVSLSFAAAEKALVPSLVAKQELTAANGFIESTGQIAGLVGPVAAGVLIPLLASPVTVLYIDGATFLFSALCLVLMKVAEPGPAGPADTTPGRALVRFWGESAAGLRFLFSNRVLMVVMTTAVVVNFAVSPILVIFPYLAQKVLQAGAPGFGWLMGSFGGGMLVGSLLAGRISRRFSFEAVVFGGMGVVAAALAALGFGSQLWIVMALGALIGLVVAPGNALIITELQQRTPSEMQGRVFAALSSGAALSMPAGIALASGLLGKLPLARITTGMAVVVLAAALLGFLTFRRIERPGRGIK